MSLRSQLRAAPSKRDYNAFGYLENPFPPRGQVNSDVYMERPELVDLESGLVTFLKGEGKGRTWAVAADSGIGKSNLLQHLEKEIAAAVDEGSIGGVAHHYLNSQQMNPRGLAEAVARAIGEEAMGKLFVELRNSDTAVSADLVGTPLGDLLERVRSAKVNDSTEVVRRAARFAVRWLSGQQTYAEERREYGISARERVAPAIGLPWLRRVLDMMEEQKVLSRIVLLLDEFEDVQALSTSGQNDYLMTLKGLINAFNLERLFLIIGGQPNTLERLGQRLPSLKSRWEIVTLEPLRKPQDALRLARSYMQHARQEWLLSSGSKEEPALEPTDLVVQAVFGELLARVPAHGVRQRDMLSSLHDRFEKLRAD